MAAQEDVAMPRPTMRSQNDDMRPMMNEVRGMTELVRTRHALAIALPVFDGSTDVEDFLELFENIAMHNGWSVGEMAIRLRLSVMGSAGINLHGSNYLELREKLVANHSISMENAMTVLKMLRLRPGDNEFSFSDKLCKLVSKAFPKMERESVDRHAMRELIAMLPPNSQAAWLFKAQPRHSLEEAVHRIHEANPSVERKMNQLDATESSSKLSDKMMAMMQGTQASMQTLVQRFAEGQKQIAEGQKQMLEMLLQKQRRGPLITVQSLIIGSAGAPSPPFHLKSSRNFWLRAAPNSSQYSGKLKIRDSAVRCCDSQGNLLKVNVQVRQDTVLPPRTEKFSMAQLSTKWVQGTACIESTNKVPGVLVATTVQNPNEQQVHLRLMNYTDREIRIPAGKIVATCMAANLTRPAPTESASRGQLSEHLTTLVKKSCQRFSPEEKQKVQALITEHQSAFSSFQYDLGKTNMIKHGILLVPEAKPLKQ
ncbi:uncharacterized protein [Watersipora subatra]|uniref:uncharacterized protein n=1 Tax=Watersipora subatra TaxID=2589382 RepID=UPI00355BE55D